MKQEEHPNSMLRASRNPFIDWKEDVINVKVEISSPIRSLLKSLQSLDLKTPPEPSLADTLTEVQKADCKTPIETNLLESDSDGGDDN